MERKDENVSSGASNRRSRLPKPQPRKSYATPHAVRMRSLSSENIATSYNRNFKRARSATPCFPIGTPSHTPITRPQEMAFTPSNVYSSRRPNKIKPVNEQSARVVEVLRKHFGNNFISGGLQSMSSKQFVEIMKYLAQTVCGNKIQINENNVDDIKRFVQFMEYPHQINKSWFKTPTVPVTFDHILQLLDWLCDFVAFDENKSVNDSVENVDVLTDISNIFSNQKCIQTFVQDSKKIFSLWNDQKPEFEECKSRMTETLIIDKVQIPDIKTQIKRVKSQCDDLLSKRTSYGDDSQLQTQQKKRDQLNKEVNQLRASIDINSLELQENLRELNVATENNNILRKTVDDLKLVIQNQPVSANGRQNIIAEIKQKKDLAEEKLKYVNELQSLSGSNQVKIARLRKQKMSLIFDFNIIIQKLFQVPIDFNGTTNEQLLIKENDSINQINKKIQLFAGIRQVIAARLNDVQVILTEAETNFTSVKNKQFEIEGGINTEKKKLHSLEVKIQKIENEIIDTMHTSEQQQNKLQSKIDALLKEREQAASKIKFVEMQGKALKEENEKISEEIQLKAVKLLEEKKLLQAHRMEALSELVRLCKDLKSRLNYLK